MVLTTGRPHIPTDLLEQTVMTNCSLTDQYMLYTSSGRALTHLLKIRRRESKAEHYLLRNYTATFWHRVSATPIAWGQEQANQ